jgi:heme/copper-type cytochrome/quinol oxidase subunit 4
MVGKKLQLAGVIAYLILAVIFVFTVSNPFLSGSFTINKLLITISIFALFQVGLIMLITNYIKTDKSSLFTITALTIARIVSAPLILSFLGILYGRMLSIEVIGKIILGVYNISVTIYVISKNKKAKNNEIDKKAEPVKS